MTKINKNFTLDIEIVEKLKQIENASALISQLLEQYFQFNGEKKNNLIQQTTFQLKNYLKNAKILKKNIKILNDFEQKGIDKYVIRWLKAQEIEPLHLDILNYKKGRDLNIKIDDIFKAWEVIQKNVQLFKEI